MDGVTQVALGAVLGEALAGRRIGRAALGMGAVLGLLRSVEGLMVPWLDEARALEWRGAWVNSPVMWAAVAWAAGKWVGRVGGSVREGMAWGSVIWLVLGAADALGGGGTACFAPVSWERVAWGILPETDPVVSGVLLAGLLWLLRDWRKASGAPQRSTGKKARRPVVPVRRTAVWVLAAVVGWVLLAAGVRSRIDSQIRADLTRRHHADAAWELRPTPGNILVWRAVALVGEELWVGYRTLWDAEPVWWTHIPRTPSAWQVLDGSREGAAVARATRGWWVARPTTEGAWIADFSVPESRIWRADGVVDWQAGRAWSFVPRAPRGRLIPRLPEGGSSGDTAWRLSQRAIGVDGCWDLPSRLTGVRGSFPCVLDGGR